MILYIRVNGRDRSKVRGVTHEDIANYRSDWATRTSGEIADIKAAGRAVIFATEGNVVHLIGGVAR